MRSLRGLALLALLATCADCGGASTPRTSADHATPRAWLDVRSEMDSRFVLDHAHASIDGETVPTAGRVPAAVGRHELVVDLTFHFESQCIYCYARAWTFALHGKHTFDVAADSDVALHAIAYERGGVTTPIEERPALRLVDAAVRGKKHAAVMVLVVQTLVSRGPRAASPVASNARACRDERDPVERAACAAPSRRR